jgi:3-hydroxy-9,10-secoandrosta-1,3,5(10)-triene-9,17-dione monooxygenase reductase component
MSSQPSDEVPGPVGPDARGSWCSPELVWSAEAGHDVDFELRPGEDVSVHDDPDHVAAARRFRDVLGRFASGVTVVTGMDGDRPVGLTCQSFSSVSLEPPLVLVVLAKSSRAWPLIERAGAFCVNVLAAEQVALSEVMASRGVDKFAGVEWRPSTATGAPVLAGALAHVDCTIEAVHEAGDHCVAIGRVVGLLTAEDEAPDDPAASAGPLLFYRGGYRTLDGRVGRRVDGPVDGRVDGRVDVGRGPLPQGRPGPAAD